MPTFGSLFAGIGGIDLGLERAGWTGRWQVEYEPFCTRVLARHWPDVARYGDVHDVHGANASSVADAERIERPERGHEFPDGSPAARDAIGHCPNCLPYVDLIAGGFPCQPFSNAGKRKGKDDERWLWPEFARVIGDLRPRYVLVENVPGLLAGHGGMGAVLGDLAALGYDAEWDSIPASAVGAPHLRYRVWIVGTQQSGTLADADTGRPCDPVRAGRDAARDGGADARRGVAYTNGLGRGRQAPLGPPGLTGLRSEGAGPEPDGTGAGTVADAERWSGEALDEGRLLGEPSREGPTERLADGYLFGEPWGGDGWLPEPDVGRVAHGVPARMDRLRSLGNAVVPQVVEVIGRRILEAEGLR